jgi:hypothetical protein
VTIGTWQPGNKPVKAIQISDDLLQRFISLGNETEIEDLANALTPAEISEGAVLMTINRSNWDFLRDRDVQSLIALIRFFTLAEAQLPGWQAGDKSPVIALVGILKQRDEFSDELRKWIKSNTDNRYLPYGSVL